jgi:DbpA-like RNA binding protein
VSDPTLATSAATRGNNLVCLAPPSPSAVRIVLRGVLERQGTAGGRSLALAPAEALEEWARVAAQLAPGDARVAAARTPARLGKLLAAGASPLLFTTAHTAHELLRRAALKPAELAGMLLLWPEAWGDDALAGELLQEVPKETPRIVVSTDAVASASFIERYCWRAPVADLLGPAPIDAAPKVRSMPVAWNRRGEALLDLVEQLDPATLAIWVADPADRDAIEDAMRASGSRAAISHEPPAPAALVVAYDLPSPAGLRTLAAAGPVVLLTPPATEGYVARLAPQRAPLHQQGALGSALAGLARSRRTVAAAVERGGPAPAAYFALAPLFERYEATAVAATLYELWEAAQAGQSEAAPAAAATGPSERLWIAVGKRDSVTPHDLVAALINEGGVAKAAIGKVEIRETFSLVEVSASADPAQVAERLTGKTIRKRRVVARVDKGRPSKVRGER